MNQTDHLGGSLKLANTSLTVNRMGYGAQLGGPQVWDRLATSMAQCGFGAKQVKLV